MRQTYSRVLLQKVALCAFLAAEAGFIFADETSVGTCNACLVLGQVVPDITSQALLGV